MKNSEAWWELRGTAGSQYHVLAAGSEIRFISNCQQCLNGIAEGPVGWLLKSFTSSTVFSDSIKALLTVGDKPDRTGVSSVHSASSEKMDTLYG
jgi:hypothetical protein